MDLCLPSSAMIQLPSSVFQSPSVHPLSLSTPDDKPFPMDPVFASDTRRLPPIPALPASTMEGVCSPLPRHDSLDRRAAFLEAMKTCKSLNDLGKARIIHSEIVQKELFSMDACINNAILSMYTNCGSLYEARDVFDELPVRNAISWNALMAGYTRHGQGAEALKCFRQMQDEGLVPNLVTYLCVLKACSVTGSASMGEKIHKEVEKYGYLEKDAALGTALVDMYAKCNQLQKAQEVFDGLPQRTAISWNALITGYAQHGRGKEALECFRKMRDAGFSPTAITFVCVLKACSSIGSAEVGEAIHAEICKRGLLETDFFLAASLVDMYAKCSMLGKAQEVFDTLPRRDVVTWNALISGYSQQGLGDEALDIYKRMKDQGFSPNAVTFICVLDACSSIGSLEMGEAIHLEINRKGLLQKDIALGNALVDMYAKCGLVEKAHEVFNELLRRDVVSWNALMAGYAQLGRGEMVLDLFSKLKAEGVNPDLITFLIVLHACCHAGLTEEGIAIFDDMNFVYHLTPTLKHYSSMVDLFSRAGYFHKAIAVIEKVPYDSRLKLFKTLLASCRKWVNVELGRWAFEQAVQIDHKYPGLYICMSNIYAAAGMQEEAEKIKALRVKNEAWCTSGRSWWTDAHRNVHSFKIVNDGHPEFESIYKKLEEICKRMLEDGKRPCPHWLVRTDANCGEEFLDSDSSEKLAIAYALINAPNGMPIRVAKNTRICPDCHSTISLIAQMEKRKIQVKDSSGIHVFEDGKCICGEDHLVGAP